MILRDPAPTEQTGGTTSAPVQLPVVTAKPAASTSKVPENIEKLTFSNAGMDDIKVEQLPPQESKDKKKTESVVTEKKTEIPVEGEKKDDTGVSRFLKPPTTEKKSEVTGEKKEVIKQIGLDKVNRDYSGYTADEVSALKQMSNEGFQLATKVIKENRELAKLKDSTYLQHNDAYTLDPVYKQTQTDSHFAIKEANYWESQLVAMDRDGEFTPITGWNEDGSPVLGAKRPATKADEEKVRLLMQNCYRSAQTLQEKLQSIPKQYKDRLSGDLAAIQNERKNRFAWVANPELEKHSIQIDGLGDRTLGQIRQDFRSLFPAYLQNHPALDVAADLMIAMRIQSAELNELKSGQAVAQTMKSENERIEPSSKDKASDTGGEVVHGMKEFKLEPIV